MRSPEAGTVKFAYVTMLGTFSITVDDMCVSDEANRTHKLWNVLAYLIVHRDRMVSQGEFIEQFWPEETGSGPANALKTQLYRIRTMLTPLFGGEFQPILSQRGGYEWNSAIRTEVDIDRFSQLCQSRNQMDGRDDSLEESLQEAISIYQGDFLPKLSASAWVGPISEKYHGLYVDAIARYAASLEEKGLHEEMVSVVQRAIAIDALDEKLHTIIVRGLLQQGKHMAALTHYEYATDLLYRHLGVQQWKELRDLYDQIMATEQAFETDLTVIQQELKETAEVAGAFFCEYGFFKEIYRLEARRSTRSGVSIHVALITVSNIDGTIPALKSLNKTMDQLQEVIAQTLRNGDVVARYSSAQYVVMLPGASLEDSEMVVGRLLSKFRRRHRVNRLKISSRIREIELLGGEVL